MSEMNPERAETLIRDSIENVSAQMRMVSQNYEALFSNFNAVLVETIGDAPSLQDAARIAFQLADSAVETVRLNFVGQPVFECSKGCSACCHLYVAVPPGVADLIADHIQADFSSSEQVALIGRLTEYAIKAKEHPDPQKLRARCPLLDDTGSCTIYEVRPLSCRSFTSVSRKACEDMVFGPASNTQGVDQNPARYRIYEGATKALKKTALQRGLPSHQTGLVQSLLGLLSA